MKIHTLSGIEKCRIHAEAGQKELQVAVADWTEGFYLWKVQVAGRTYAGKLIVVR